jgi:hypothetical protein
MPETKQLAQQLEKFMPLSSCELVAGLLIKKNAQLTISRPRKTKLGDYRPPQRHAYHRISVNGDLNPFAFLLVTIHEFAHLLVWNNHKNKVKAHGNEWKNHYRQLYQRFEHCFPDDIQAILKDHFKNLTSATLNNPLLIRNLVHMDNKEEIILVQDLKTGDTFDFNNKRFKIIEKRRTRYLCKNTSNGRNYLVSGVAVVNGVIE